MAEFILYMTAVIISTDVCVGCRFLTFTCDVNVYLQIVYVWKFSASRRYCTLMLHSRFLSCLGLLFRNTWTALVYIYFPRQLRCLQWFDNDGWAKGKTSCKETGCDDLLVVISPKLCTSWSFVVSTVTFIISYCSRIQDGLTFCDWLTHVVLEIDCPVLALGL